MHSYFAFLTILLFKARSNVAPCGKLSLFPYRLTNIYRKISIQRHVRIARTYVKYYFKFIAKYEKRLTMKERDVILNPANWNYTHVEMLFL